MFKLVLLIVALFLSLFVYPHKILAGGIKVGPFKALMATGYNKSDFNPGIIKFEIYAESADGTTKMPNGDMQNYYSWELQAGANCPVLETATCLGYNKERSVASSPTGRTKITYSASLSGDTNKNNFQKTQGNNSGIVLENDKTTEEIIYTWVPVGIVSQPTINIAPSQIVKVGTPQEAFVTINLGENKSSSYNVSLSTDENAKTGDIGSFQVLCSNPECSVRNQANILQNASISLNGNTLSFKVSSTELTTSNYFIVINGRYIQTVSGNFGVVAIIIDDVKPMIEPSELDTKLTSKASIKISLENGANGKYNVIFMPPTLEINPRIPQISCQPSKNQCFTTFQLPEIGLGPNESGYQIIIRDTANKDRGSVNLKVAGNPEDRPGGVGSKTGTGSTETKTSAGGTTCDTSNGDTVESLQKNKGKTKDEAENIITSLSKERIGVYTAIGCIPTEPTALIQGIIKFAIAAGSGIALLLMIYGAFQMITSAGNPDGVKKGHEQITSAVIGLLFIIFAVMLLKVIGVDILQIPGFQ